MEEDQEKQSRPQGYRLEKHASMLRRCESHDYTARCFYMVTMATEGRWDKMSMQTVPGCHGRSSL
ncbi:MAG: hypothetical protein KA067_01245 [Prevotella sp.]|nr:hypothetical protein [Prevotella sp.]